MRGEWREGFARTAGAGCGVLVVLAGAVAVLGFALIVLMMGCVFFGWGW